MISSYETMEKNRRCFVLEFLSGMSQFTLVTGAFLAGYVKMLGGSNSLNGLMATLPAVMGLFQVFSAYYFERLEKRKPALLRIVFILRIMMGMAYVIPICIADAKTALIVFGIIYSVTFGINAFAMPVQNDILIDSIPQSIRGRYLAQREAVGFFVASLLGFGLGRMLDSMKVTGAESRGFLFVGMTVVVLGLVNIFSVYKVKEVSTVRSESTQTFKNLLKLPFKSRGFRRIIYLFALWNFGFQLGAPFVAVYMVADLNVSYTMMTVYGIMTSVMRIIFPSLWGRLSDCKSWYLSVKGSIGLLALAMVLWYFVDAQNVAYMAPLLFLLTGFAWSGIGLSLFNIQYMYAKKEGRTMYIGLNASVGGVFSLVGVLTGGVVVNTMGMQMSFIMSGIVLALCPVYVKYFVEQIPPEE